MNRTEPIKWGSEKIPAPPKLEEPDLDKLLEVQWRPARFDAFLASAVSRAKRDRKAVRVKVRGPLNAYYVHGRLIGVKVFEGSTGPRILMRPFRGRGKGGRRERLQGN